MELNGRSLSERMAGDDVRLLQHELIGLGFKIASAETDARSFGETTARAVVDIQRAHGLDAGGVVDQRTAAAIKPAVASLSVDEFVVRGVVQRAAGAPEEPVIVRLFDRDLRSEEFLGEQTVSDGRYEILYRREQFRRAEKGTADLLVRAFAADGSVLAEARMLNPPVDAVVELHISPADDESDLETELADVEPLLEGMALTDLTDDDVDFLVAESGIARERLALIRSCAQLARDTGAPLEAFYGCQL
jgi:hypothetical protein